jgi:NADH dehydrogenase FAD-containing subunit
MPKHLVLAGAGHAHVVMLTRLAEITAKGHKVTVIGPAPMHYYSGMGPGMLGGTYTPDDIGFPVKSMVEKAGGRFIVGKVASADPEAKQVNLESGESVAYDLVSFNTGSAIPDAIVEQDAEEVYRVKPIENLYVGRGRVLEICREKEVRIGVVGGGPGSLEVAGNAWAAARENGGKGASIRVYAGRKFLHKAPSGVESRARAVFEKRGIQIIEGSYASKVKTGQVGLQDGREFEEDLIFLTTGVKPRPIFEPSGFKVGKDGGLLVNKYLQSPDYPEVFGGGDCVWFEPKPLDKVGVYAVRQNPVLFHNVMAGLEGSEMMEFIPQKNYLLIYNLGAGEGILHKWGIIIGGSLAFKFKDYLDKDFIKKFMPA